MLNVTLPAPYYARLQMRPEVGVIDDDTGEAYRRSIVPAVTVIEHPGSGENAGMAATAVLPRTEVSGHLTIIVPDLPGRHLSVEVRDPRRRHRLRNSS